MCGSDLRRPGTCVYAAGPTQDFPQKRASERSILKPPHRESAPRVSPGITHERVVLLISVSSLLLAAPVRAGINLSWDDCGSAGSSRKDFACDTNTGVPFRLIGSIAPNQTVGAVVGASAQINILGTQPQLPDWWKFGSAACRGSTALGVSFDFQSSGPYTCTDLWLTRAQGMMTYQVMNATDARILLSTALPQGETVSFDSGTEYYVFRLNLGRSRSTGTGSCAGCSMPACLLLDNVQLFQNPVEQNDPIDSAPANSNAASWHGAYLFTWDDFENGRSGIGCAPDLPTKAGRSTWGAVKSLYR